MEKSSRARQLGTVDSTPVLLFAEDDADIAFLVCREFRRHLPTWEICHVSDGREAAARMERGLEPRLLVTDLKMPGMDGFALIEWVRRNKDPDLSIFVLSSSLEPEAVSHCRELGVDQFFNKNTGSVHETVAALIASFLEKDGDAEAGAKLGRQFSGAQDALPSGGSRV